MEKRFKTALIAVGAIMIASDAKAQGGLGGYVGPVSSMMLAGGAIAGVVGGIKVYMKWQTGSDITGEIVGWGGACVMLVLGTAVIKAFFGY